MAVIDCKPRTEIVNSSYPLDRETASRVITSQVGVDKLSVRVAVEGLRGSPGLEQNIPNPPIREIRQEMFVVKEL